jgi:hypothetical protein
MINSILTFVIGAGVGAVTSIFIVKKHYEEVSKQEIESVKEVYAKKKEMDEASKLDEDLKAVNEVIKKNGYATESEERVKKTEVTDNTGEDTDEDENDPDAVYVRNDVQKIDYEILKEYRGFSDYLEEQDE